MDAFKESDDLGLEDDIRASQDQALEESPGGDSNVVDDDHQNDASQVSSDDESYSNRVRRRIGKEVYLRKTAEEREQQIAQQNAQLSAELAALRADLESVKTRNAAADAQAVEGTLQAKLQAARQRLLQTKIDQDYEDELTAADEYAMLRAEERDLKRRQAQSQQPPSRQASDALALGTTQWLQQNQWYLSGSHPHLASMAAALDAALQTEGFSPNDPALYAELNKRLRAAVPAAASVLRDIGNQPSPRKPDPGPPSGANSADGGTASSPRRLTNADLARMEQFGLDPNDKEARRIWLQTHQ